MSGTMNPDDAAMLAKALAAKDALDSPARARQRDLERQQFQDQIRHTLDQVPMRIVVNGKEHLPLPPPLEGMNRHDRRAHRAKWIKDYKANRGDR